MERRRKLKTRRYLTLPSSQMPSHLAAKPMRYWCRAFPVLGAIEQRCAEFYICPPPATTCIRPATSREQTSFFFPNSILHRADGLAQPWQMP
jgi:hypothetical protein